METDTSDFTQISVIDSNTVEQSHNNSVSEISNDGGTKLRHDISEVETRGTLEVIAATGKFWHDWDELKNMLSSHLKQALSEYPEAKATSEEQTSSLGETFEELVKRLDDALCSFIEGPPFTLQRLCEILLAAHSIYPNLSKLALALEKNLFVTSMLTISIDLHLPPTEPRLTKLEREKEDSRPQPYLLQNGVEPVAANADELMTEVEDAEVDDDLTIDMEKIEAIVRPSETKFCTHR